MFHSIPVSEPLAQFFGLVAGLVTYALTGAFDHQSRLVMAEAASILTNLLIGAPINVATLDALGLLIARPLSAAAGAGLLALVVR